MNDQKLKAERKYHGDRETGELPCSWLVLVVRDGPQPKPVIVPAMKFEAYHRYVSDLTREISRAVFVARDRVRARDP